MGAGSRGREQAAPAGGTAAAMAPTPVPSASTSIVGNAAPAQSLVDFGGANRIWILAALLFAALWLFTLVWGLHRGDAQADGVRPEPSSPDAPRANQAGHLANEQRDDVDDTCHLRPLEEPIERRLHLRGVAGAGRGVKAKCRGVDAARPRGHDARECHRRPFIGARIPFRRACASSASRRAVS